MWILGGCTTEDADNQTREWCLLSAFKLSKYLLSWLVEPGFSWGAKVPFLWLGLDLFLWNICKQAWPTCLHSWKQSPRKNGKRMDVPCLFRQRLKAKSKNHSSSLTKQLSLVFFICKRSSEKFGWDGKKGDGSRVTVWIQPMPVKSTAENLIFGVTFQRFSEIISLSLTKTSSLAHCTFTQTKLVQHEHSRAGHGERCCAHPGRLKQLLAG